MGQHPKTKIQDGANAKLQGQGRCSGLEGLNTLAAELDGFPKYVGQHPYDWTEDVCCLARVLVV